jgi:hypothetical protein
VHEVVHPADGFALKKHIGMNGISGHEQASGLPMFLRQKGISTDGQSPSDSPAASRAVGGRRVCAAASDAANLADRKSSPSHKD